MSLLLHVPLEILTTIARFLACGDPYSPPRDLLALQITSRYFNEHLNCHLNPAVWAAAFRFRFDHLAVIRRNFRPNGRDYYDQLRQYTEALATIRKQDIANMQDDEMEVMRTIYVMLLDNNGKDRSQLEHVGVDSFLFEYVRTRLRMHTERSNGWPLDSGENVYALWSIWMLTTPQKLQQETVPQRELIVASVLPYVINPYRYPQAEAPPSHFHLPLPADQQRGTIVLPTSEGASAHGPYPVYIHPSREVQLPYFGSMPAFSPPPITLAAKLLYFCRREIIPFGIPPHLPRTRAEAPPSNEPRPVQEDFIEINAHRGALPPPCITWDWAQGCTLVNGIPDHSDVDHSASWDPDYWRRRLCGYAWRPNPKWRPGKVYVPGSMDGLWQGRLVLPMEMSMRHLIEHAAFPGSANFNESALNLTHQPLFMRLKELHAVSTSSSSPHLHVPFPPPYPAQQQFNNNDDLSDWSDLSMCNAWFPGQLGSLDFHSNSNSPRNSRLYAPPGQPKNVLVQLEGHAPPPGTYPASPYTHEANAWLYTQFDRRLDKERRQRATEMDDDEYRHEGCEECEVCRERQEAVNKARLLDEKDHEAISETYDKEWRSIDEIFESVGLGRDETHPDDDMFDGDEDDEDDSSIAGGGNEDIAVGEDEEAPEFIQDPGAEVNNSTLRPLRRGTDRARIAECDGIKDIIFSGTTDRRHALAWNKFTFYGRVRPWDGLIGILRRSFWPHQNFIFFYGYLVGSESFVGNWRFAAHDPNLPTWESAFVMSRKKDDAGRGDDE